MPSWTSHSSGDCDRRAVRHCRRFHRRRSVRVGAVEALYKVWVDANKTEHRREVTWKMVAKSATKVGLREPSSKRGASGVRHAGR